MPTIRKAYGKKSISKVHFHQPTMTKQSHKNECDINQIMDKFQRTNVLEHGNKNQADYGEIPSEDFQIAMNIIADSNSMFETLPSSVRKRFQNDPQKYLEFLENPENKEEMRKMGLLEDQKTPPEDVSEAPSDNKNKIKENTADPKKKVSED